METIDKNKKKFLALLNEVSAERKGIDNLISWLEKGDFFTAPASTRFHEAYEGGLLKHSLNVYDSFMLLFSRDNDPITSVILITLLHDLCKSGFYKKEFRNTKDEKGQWVKVPCYTVDDQFPLGHGEKSVYLIERFVRLKPEEAVAIRWHMGGFDEAVKGGSYALSAAYDKYPLAAKLHLADMYATYLYK